MSDSSSVNSPAKAKGHESSAFDKDVQIGATTDLGLLSEVEHFANGSLSSEDVEIIAAHLDDRTTEEAREVVENAIEYHRGDACLSQTYREHMLRVVKGPMVGQTEEEWEALLKFDAFLIKDWSIYPEVRSVTRPIDEEEEGRDYETLRVYIVSILWSCAGSTLATFFAPRFPSISINNVALQLLIAYTGRLFRYIPGFTIPLGFGHRLDFGSGPWSFKEQMLATAGMGAGNQAPYSLYVVLAMSNDHFYGYKNANSFGFIILLTLATNTMGFGLSGLFRVFLVYPTRMVWYNVLPNLKLGRVLVRDENVRENINGWKLKGWEFFWIFSFAEFAWYWVTDFLFIFLGYFDWMSWINPTNNNLLSICGAGADGGGLGLNPVPSLDFSIFLPTAMVTPYFATVGMMVGMAISACGLCVMFWTNVRHTAFFPINTNSLYDNTGQPYDVSKILDDDFQLDEEKYQSYSQPWWSAGNVSIYGAAFMFFPAMLSYAALNYFEILVYSGKIFVQTVVHPKKALASFDDRFTRAQRKNKEVPEWWYLIVLCSCIGMGIAFVEHYGFVKTPVWTIFFGIGLSAVFMIPEGVLFATTNTQMVINELYELIIGLTNRGNASALMVSKAFATNFMVETDSFLSNLKIGHYCAIGPRPMFRIQIINAVANSFVQSGLMVWQATPGSIPGMCDLDSPDKFTCQDIRTYFNAAVQWGTIGTARIFKGHTGVYPSMRWVFLIGALYPVPFWLVRRFGVPFARKRNWGAIKQGGSRFRNNSFIRKLVSMEWINNINEIVVLTGAQNWAPSSFQYYIPWLYIGLIFQVIIPRYWPRWWQKYNYLLYAAISVGYSYGALILFFSTSYHHIASIDWWGNDKAISLTPSPRFNVTLNPELAPDGYFGTRKGNFPR